MDGEHGEKERQARSHTPQLRDRLVGRLTRMGIGTYVEVHNTLVGIRDHFEERREARDDATPWGPGARSATPSAHRWVSSDAASSDAVRSCWNLVTRRDALEHAETLKLMHDDLRRSGWGGRLPPSSSPDEPLRQVGVELVELIKQRVVSPALVRGEAPDAVARELDRDIAALVAGDVAVGTGPLPALLDLAMSTVAAGRSVVRSPAERPHDPMLGSSRS